MSSQVTKSRAKEYYKLQLQPFEKKRFRFVPRSEELLKLEGYYEVKLDYPLEQEYEDYKKSSGRLGFSKWLINNKGIKDPSKLCKEVSEGRKKFKLTCRYNDILRMSETKSYDACTAPGRMGANAIIKLCKNPNFAMLVIAGPSGHFIGRIGFIFKDGRVQLFRAYGVFSIEAAKKLFVNLGYQIEEKLYDIVADIDIV